MDTGNQKVMLQKMKVLVAFKKRPMTMMEAEVVTGVNRSNICWYFREYRRLGQVAITRQRICSITKYPNVNEYTADRDLFPNHINAINHVQ